MLIVLGVLVVGGLALLLFLFGIPTDKQGAPPASPWEAISVFIFSLRFFIQ